MTQLGPDASWTVFAFPVDRASKRLAAGEKLTSRTFHTPNGWAWKLGVHLQGFGNGAPDCISAFLEMADAPLQLPGMVRNAELILDIATTDRNWLSSLPCSFSTQCGILGDSVFSLKTGWEHGFQRLCAKSLFSSRCVSKPHDTCVFIIRVRIKEDEVHSDEYFTTMVRQMMSTMPLGFAPMVLYEQYLSLWEEVQSWSNIDLTRPTLTLALFHAFFNAMPATLCANWFRECEGEQTVPALLEWLAKDHVGRDPALCRVCHQPIHRGRCQLHFSRQFVLDSPRRMSLSARPVICALEALRFEQEDWFDLDSRLVEHQAVADALKDAESAVGETAARMDELVALVDSTLVFLPHIGLRVKLQAFVEDLPVCLVRLAQASAPASLDKFKTEHGLLDDELRATGRTMKQVAEAVDEKRRQTTELEQLDSDIAACASKQRAQAGRQARALKESAARLAEVKQEAAARVQRLTADLAEALKLQQQAHRLQMDLAKTRKLLVASQLAPCVHCQLPGSGLLAPCEHAICSACFDEAVATSQLLDVPFLHTHCSACAKPIATIRFPPPGGPFLDLGGE